MGLAGEAREQHVSAFPARLLTHSGEITCGHPTAEDELLREEELLPLFPSGTFLAISAFVFINGRAVMASNAGIFFAGVGTTFTFSAQGRRAYDGQISAE